jgi:hypothetical protein
MVFISSSFSSNLPLIISSLSFVFSFNSAACFRNATLSPLIVLENMNNQITYLRKIISQLSVACNNKRNEIACLQFGIQELEGYANGLNNQQEVENETYR